MNLPNFVGIGAQRAATTWLHECLHEHPEVFVPPAKELHFFTDHYDKGIDWYAGHFQPRKSQRVIGEVTPNYLESEIAIARMADIIPQARLVVILREPVERAISAYNFFPGLFGHLSFAEACRTTNLATIGMYAQHLARIYSHYSKEQVKIFLYDDIQVTPAQVVRELYSFIGANSSFTPPSLSTRYNNSSRSTLPERMLRTFRMGWAVEVFKRTHLRRWLKRLKSKKQTPATVAIKPEILQEFRKTFRDDTLRLQEMIGRDLTSWLAPVSPADPASKDKVLVS